VHYMTTQGGGSRHVVQESPTQVRMAHGSMRVTRHHCVLVSCASLQHQTRTLPCVSCEPISCRTKQLTVCSVCLFYLLCRCMRAALPLTEPAVLLLVPAQVLPGPPALLTQRGQSRQPPQPHQMVCSSRCSAARSYMLP
jgi:hypothetical protein